jgi:hypothetical protein
MGRVAAGVESSICFAGPHHMKKMEPVLEKLRLRDDHQHTSGEKPKVH